LRRETEGTTGFPASDWKEFCRVNKRFRLTDKAIDCLPEHPPLSQRDLDSAVAEFPVNITSVVSQQIPRSIFLQPRLQLKNCIQLLNSLKKSQFVFGMLPALVKANSE
jgi:hypothetical protein